MKLKKIFSNLKPKKKKKFIPPDYVSMMHVYINHALIEIDKAMTKLDDEKEESRNLALARMYLQDASDIYNKEVYKGL